MKISALLFLLICFLFSCSDNKADTPNLELDGVFLNGEDKDYSYNLKEILPLHAGDYIDASFLLYGNEADLVSFVMKNDNANIDVAISLYPEDEVADDFLLNDEGLRYKDGVRSSWTKVRIKVKNPKDDEEIRLAFYLNSKASDNGGAVYYLDLTTTTSPR